MSWVETTVYSAKCNNCEEQLYDGWEDFSFFSSRREAADAAESCDWFAEGDYALCDTCRYDPETHAHIWHLLELVCIICGADKVPA